MKNETLKKTKLALQWHEDEGFPVAVRIQSARQDRRAQSPKNVLVLSANHTSFARVLSVSNP